MSKFWDLGFRPFFWSAALFAALALLAWLFFLNGIISGVGSLDPVLWHSHEMVFGFSTAVIAGFILTASQNWTGIRGVHGKKLMALVALWVLARILIFTVSQPNLFISLIDLSFYPLLAVYLYPYLKEVDFKTERFFFMSCFGFFFIGNLLVHLQSIGIFPGYARQGIFLGMNSVLMVIIFMGGRVIPFFTESSASRLQPRTWPVIEVLSHITGWLFLITQFFSIYSKTAQTIAAVCALLAGGIHLKRVSGWQVKRVRRVPIIWVLHLAYFWIVLGFFLSGFALFNFFPTTLATHAFTVGGIGSIIYGMITRVSLGHTGRKLEPNTSTVAAYYLINVAALIRVFVPMANPSFHDFAVTVSGSLWIISFCLFLMNFTKFLFSKRADA